jgi:uncharacterized integral membrane protein
MTNPGKSANPSPTSVVPAGLAEGTIRIEHDRKRLALAALASGLAVLIIPCVFFAGNLHRTQVAPAWTLAPLGVAILTSALAFVRSIIRLQDGDPALVMSPRGLDFRPSLFGEIVRIPWKAIRGLKLRSYKQQRFILLQVDDVDRYAPRVGFSGVLRRIGRRRWNADQLTFSTPLAKPAWHELEAMLRRYLAQHGRPGIANGSVSASETRANVGTTASRSLQSRSLP